MTPLQEQLSLALNQLLEVLRTQEQYEEEERLLSKLTKPGGNLIHDLCRQSQTLIYLHSPSRKSVPWALQPSWREGYNHPANRYIKWLLLHLEMPVPPKLQQVPPEPLSNAAIPVLFNDPFYAKVYRLGMKILQQRQ